MNVRLVLVAVFVLYVLYAVAVITTADVEPVVEITYVGQTHHGYAPVWGVTASGEMEIAGYVDVGGVDG